MTILDRILGGSPEKQVLDRCKAIVDRAVEENKTLIKIINGSTDLKGLREIEQNSDREVFEISNSITTGAIAPNLIDDMLRFVRKEDDIVDTIFNLARAIVRYHGDDEATEKYANKNLLQLSELINSALILLYEMHKVDTLDEARVLRAKIELIEQKGDDIKDAMLDYAYKSKDIDFRSFYYIQNVAYLADDILDGCEDSSDMIVSIMRSILT